MLTPLVITTVQLTTTNGPGPAFDMSGRCAFAICTKGEFTIRILTEQFTVTEQCMFACMPFVNIDVVSVNKPSEVIFGYILIENVPRMINPWISTSNLSAIQNRPMVKMTDAMYGRIMASINEYRYECGELSSGYNDMISVSMQQDIIDLQSRLIVAQVLKAYFANIPMDLSGDTKLDIVFQRFMLALYGNFRIHRSVQFYAAHSGVSLKYFSTVVKQVSGASPSKWIETVVVSEAMSMLNDVNRSIKDIASTLNFPDAPTFTKYFNRVTGMTPKAYRKASI